MPPPATRTRPLAAVLSLVLASGLLGAPYATRAGAQVWPAPAARNVAPDASTAVTPVVPPAAPAPARPLAVAPAGLVPAGLGPVGLVPAAPDAAAADTGRPRAVVYSDAYGTRLTIHRYASYATLPVFAAEYVLGNKLVHARDRGQPRPDGVRTAHAAVAVGLGALFAVNTVTGAWNWWDARHDPNGRARRTVHSVLMLAADAGFAAAGALADNARTPHSYKHRNVSLASMGVAIGGGAMMYLWKE